jgi:hypothetical protein
VLMVGLLTKKGVKWLTEGGQLEEFGAAVADLMEVGVGERAACERALRELGYGDGKGFLRSRLGGGGSGDVVRGDAVVVPVAVAGVAKDLSKDAQGRGSQHLDAVLWVSEHLQDEVSREQAPSGVAWSLLKWCKSAPECEQDFWRAIFPKVLPTRQQIQSEMDRVDDVRHLEVARKFLESLNE